jgi:hypothetical protein
VEGPRRRDQQRGLLPESRELAGEARGPDFATAGRQIAR